MSNMTKQIEKNYLGFSGTIISALRYCLGRRTYMPSLVIGFVKPYIPKLKEKDLIVIRRDIYEQGRSYFPNPTLSTNVDERGFNKESFGDDCDYISWMQFLNDIEKELEKRGVKYGNG